MRLRQLSSVLGDTRELIVHLPERYDEEPTRRYPVIYVLNGSSQDVHTASTAALMARLGLMPELIVVGVPNISEKVVIVSESLAQRMFPNQDAVNRRFFWTIVGVAGVLAFSVSARTREFGVRLAIGSTPRHLLTGVLGEGAMIAGVGVIAGVAGGFLLARTVSAYLAEVNIPGVLPLLAAATVLVAAAILASALPAARAARVDVMQALRTE